MIRSEGIDKVYGQEYLFNAFPSRRPVVHGTHGAVSTSQPLASEAGLHVLQAGGNAADAAIAAALALCVTEPGSCGLGGDCFALYYDAETKTVSGLNGSGKFCYGSNFEKCSNHDSNRSSAGNVNIG